MRFGGTKSRASPEPAGLLGRVAVAVRNLLAGFALLVVLVTATPVTESWARFLQGGAETADQSQAKVMVVLAGSGLEEFLGETSYRRSSCAASEAKAGSYQRIIITGRGGGSKPAAVPMKAFLAASGVSADRIEVEVKSVSTRENAQFAGKMLQGERRSIALVTSDYHMRRSLRLFAKEGIRVVPKPCPDGVERAAQWRTRFEVASELALETAKIVYYKLRGWI